MERDTGTMITITTSRDSTSLGTPHFPKKVLPVEYPLFVKFKEFTKDPYWLEVLTDLSNKSSVLLKKKKYTFDGAHLFQTRNPTVTVNLSTEAGEENRGFKALKTFLKVNESMQSEADRVLSRELEEQKHSNTTSVTVVEWKKLKASAQQQHMANYIDHLVKRYNLSRKEESQVRDLLTSIQQSSHKNLTVTFVDGAIADIRELRWDEQERWMYRHDVNKITF